jgi:pimeloyl-ACP methyl ester carboxylesterase
MSRAFRALAILVGLMLLSGCGLRGPLAVERQAALPLPGSSGVVFTSDGAGGFDGTTRTVRAALRAEGMSLEVRRVEWSHGYPRIASDHLSWANIQEQARCLAAEVQAWRNRFPDRPVYLLGHSTGCAVLLEATQSLPSGSVERIVLLAPAVACQYDLRPALCCARRGIDVFYSRRDWVALGIGTGLFGTADRRWSAAAGRVGFCPVLGGFSDITLYANLRQYPWEPSQSSVGHDGGHYGAYKPGFLRASILPLLRPVRGDVTMAP